MREWFLEIKVKKMPSLCKMIRDGDTATLLHLIEVAVTSSDTTKIIVEPYTNEHAKRLAEILRGFK